MGRFANFRFKSYGGRWGYVWITSLKEIMESIRVLSGMGFMVETGKYYLPSQHGEGGLFDE